MQPVRKELDAIIAKGYGGHRVFEDWVGLMFFAFQRDDPHYLEIMGRYRNDGPMGQREADHFANALAGLMGYMSSTNEEALGLCMKNMQRTITSGSFSPLRRSASSWRGCHIPLRRRTARLRCVIRHAGREPAL